MLSCFAEAHFLLNTPKQIDTIMDQFTKNYVNGFMADLIARNPGEKEFHQAVKEVLESVAP